MLCSGYDLIDIENIQIIRLFHKLMKSPSASRLILAILALCLGLSDFSHTRTLPICSHPQDCPSTIRYRIMWTLYQNSVCPFHFRVWGWMGLSVICSAVSTSLSLRTKDGLWCWLCLRVGLRGPWRRGGRGDFVDFCSSCSNSRVILSLFFRKVGLCSCNRREATHEPTHK